MFNNAQFVYIREIQAEVVFHKHDLLYNCVIGRFNLVPVTMPRHLLQSIAFLFFWLINVLIFELEIFTV